MISERKNDHLDLCCNANVEFRTKTTLFEDVELLHSSIPELALEEIDTSTKFLGRKLNAPLIITAITGGTEKGGRINKALSEVAERYGLGFGVGSQRAMHEYPELTRTFEVRDVAPNILLLGNIGLNQAKDMKTEEIQALKEKIGADAMCIHLNSAMEIFQSEGDANFTRGYETLKRLREELGSEVIVKETGCGISREAGIKLKSIGIKFVDVAGAGGTSWIGVEVLRDTKPDMDLGKLYWDWGIPTAASIYELKGLGLKMIASGGIRSGLDIAKSIALGAQVAGVALPILQAYNSDPEKGAQNYIEHLFKGLKIALLLTGSRDLEDLKRKKFALSGKLKEWIISRGLEETSR